VVLPRIASRQEWRAARLELLTKQKELEDLWPGSIT
jgi:predicted dithiol-disulfide oxidoreductase (DUF899 family)